MPQRIQQKRLSGWRKPEGAISVVRPRKWGNPYPVSVHGREGAIKKYRAWLQRQIETERLDLTELQGHDLMCFCPLDQPCHADVLLEFANPS